MAARITWLIALCLLAGCTLPRGHLALRSASDAPPLPPAFSVYHLPGYDWSQVGRVVVLPVHNGSKYTRAGEEVRRALSAELQRLGRFEVVAPPPDYPAFHSEAIHYTGRFDEAAMFAIGAMLNADVVVHTAITQYSPYPKPKLGIVIQAVSPREAKVVASVDGLWDATVSDTVERARLHYRTVRPCLVPGLAKLIPHPEDEQNDELVVISPALFQHFVCFEAVGGLVPNAAPFPTAAAVINPQVLPMPKVSDSVITERRMWRLANKGD